MSYNVSGIQYCVANTVCYYVSIQYTVTMTTPNIAGLETYPKISSE